MPRQTSLWTAVIMCFGLPMTPQEAVRATKIQARVIRPSSIMIFPHRLLLILSPTVPIMETPTSAFLPSGSQVGLYQGNYFFLWCYVFVSFRPTRLKYPGVRQDLIRNIPL